MNLREQIDAASDLRSEDVTVPEWGGAVVRVVELSALDRVEWDEAEAARGGEEQSRLTYLARYVAACLRDPATGKRLYADGEAGELTKRNHRVLVRLFEVAARLNAEDPHGVSPKE